ASWAAGAILTFTWDVDSFGRDPLDPDHPIQVSLAKSGFISGGGPVSDETMDAGVPLQGSKSIMFRDWDAQYYITLSVDDPTVVSPATSPDELRRTISVRTMKEPTPPQSTDGPASWTIRNCNSPYLPDNDSGVPVSLWRWSALTGHWTKAGPDVSSSWSG